MNQHQKKPEAIHPGRPPIAGVSASFQIQLRVRRTQKTAYVKAARPGKLTEWCLKHLDAAARAAGFDPDKAPEIS